MRNRFTSQLEALNDGIIEMGALVEEAFAEATEALLYFNKEQAQRNIDNLSCVFCPFKFNGFVLTASPGYADPKKNISCFHLHCQSYPEPSVKTPVWSRSPGLWSLQYTEDSG